MPYNILDWSTFDGRGHLYVEVEGYPGWEVEVVVDRLATGLAITDLKINPWQRLTSDVEEGTRRLGSRVFAANEPLPMSGWSERASDVPPGGIPARLMRAINTGQLLVLARQRATEEASDVREIAERLGSNNSDLSRIYRTLASESQFLSDAPTRRTGRRGNGIDHYLLWAVRYAQKSEALVAHPIKALADETGEKAAYIRDTITDVRHRYKLLTTAGQGHAGGDLTPKAIDLLRTRADAVIELHRAQTRSTKEED